MLIRIGEKCFYVYIWYIKDTNEVFYVGKGKGNRYKNTTRRNKFFSDIYRTHDCDVQIIANNLSENEAFDLERKMISYYRNHTDFRLTNQTDGGDGTSGYSPPEEVRNKISRTSKCKWKDENYRNKMIQIRSNPNGAYKSKEFREKISKIVKGENNPNYMNYWSDEQKKHLSDVKKGKKTRAENGNSKRIICLETGEIFDCIEDACEKYKIKTSSSVSVALKEDVRTAAGLHWKYYSKELENREARIKTFIDVLSRSNNKTSFICEETGEIFITKKRLLKYLGLSIKVFDKMFHNGIIKFRDKNYMLIKKYVNCPVYQ